MSGHKFSHRQILKGVRFTKISESYQTINTSHLPELYFLLKRYKSISAVQPFLRQNKMVKWESWMAKIMAKIPLQHLIYMTNLYMRCCKGISGKAWTTESVNWFDRNICQVILIIRLESLCFTTSSRMQLTSDHYHQVWLQNGTLFILSNPVSSWERTKAHVQEKAHQSALNRG